MSSSCEVTNGLLYEKNSHFTAHMDPKETCPLDIKFYFYKFLYESLFFLLTVLVITKRKYTQRSTVQYSSTRELHVALRNMNNGEQ
jgi:hypothetical protein